MKSIILGLFLISAIHYVVSGYVGKVVNYTPYKKVGTPFETIMKNTDTLLATINNAQIVVLPEYGLTGVDILDQTNYREYAIDVPFTDEAPCDFKDEDIHKALKDFSCRAREVRAYVVLNLWERSSSDVIYNTNLVFANNGSITARYRKINLFGTEVKLLTAGKDIVTFETSFGVTFGLFTCYDILFRNSSIDLLDKNVNDVLFPTAWFSQLPFLASLAVHDGYARRHGINFLASGYNEPDKGSSGSGIYHANAVYNAAITPANGVIVVKDNVTTITNKNPGRTCSLEARSQGGTERGIGQKPTIDNLKMQHDIEVNKNLYRFHPVDSNTTESSGSVCSHDNLICCNFKSTLNQPFDAAIMYYRYVAFSNGEEFACGLVSCKNESEISCGQRVAASKDITFKFVNVKSTTTPAYSLDIPITLNSDYYPMIDYKYCATSGLELEANYTSGVVTLGFYGRVQNGTNSVHASSMHIIFTLFISLLLVTIFRK